jgi:hypothetical protein
MKHSKLIDASVLATKRAYELAIETGLSIVIAEEGKLFKIDINGKREFLRDLEKPTS